MAWCGRSDCLCTHTAPCERGWLPMPPLHHNGQDYERVAPCPVCRPNAAGRLAVTTERTSRSVSR